MTGSFIAKIAGSVTAVVAIVGFMWQAGPVVADLQEIYEQKESILHTVILVQEVHQLQSRVSELEIENDSLKIKVDVLTSGKFPYDSLWVNTRQGWKIFSSDTKWIWKIRD